MSLWCLIYPSTSAVPEGGNGVIGNGVSARRKAFYTDKGGKQLTQGPPLHCAGRQRAKTWFMSNMKASREGHHESQTAYNFGILGNSHCRCNSLVVHPVPLMQGHEDQAILFLVSLAFAAL